MDLDRGNLISEQKDLGIQCSWIPVTPVKASQENNKLGHENLVRSENFLTGFSRENQEEIMVESYDSTNCFEAKRSVNNWDTALPVKALVSGSNARGNEHTYIDPMARWNNIPFVDLFTQAARGSTSAQAEFMAPSSAYDCSYNRLIGSSCAESVSSSSLPQTCDLSLGLNQPTDGHFQQQMAQCELPYDLNALPDTIITDELPSSNIFQFAPITPGKRPNQDNRKKNEDTILQVGGIKDNNQEKMILTLDASFSTASTLVNPEKESDQVIDFSTTPLSEPRKRKHRPRVITESKPRTRKPAAPKPEPSKENSTGKRKYARKQDLDWTPPPEVAREITDPKPAETKIRSSRRVLNFGSDVQSPACNSVYVNKGSQEQQFWSGKVPTKTTLPIYRGMEGKIINKRTGIAYDLVCSMNKQLTDYMSLPTRQAACNPHPTNTSDSDKLCEREQINFKNNKHLAPRAANESCIATARVTGPTIPKKRQCADIPGMENPSTVNLNGAQSNGLNSYSAFHVQALNRTMHFPEIYKKRRTESTASNTASPWTAAKDIVQLVRERLQNDSNALNAKSTANFGIYAPHLQTNRAQITQAETVRVAAMDRVRDFVCMLALGDKDRLTKKRSKGSTRVRNLASLEGFAKRKMLPTLPGIKARAEISHVPQNCIETLVAEIRATLARRKRSKTHVLSRTNAVQMGQNNVQYTRRNILSNAKGLPLKFVWKHMPSVDAITERLKHLHINMESNIKYNAVLPYTARYQSQALVPHHIKKQEENALVVCGRDGTIVPFDGPFYPIKKRQSRPKVDLDEETTRVWQLLLENINNTGIDGTDEQKEKWWEEERRVFRGRADSFIARMHLVQGDRRFSRWKGSVLDSVVGVFLTQNVSDHLSSSAFMSMASHFPVQSNGNKQQCYQEESNPLVEEPDLCILDDMVYSQSSLMPNETEHTAEKEVSNSSDSFGCSTGSLSSNDAFIGRQDYIKSKLGDLGNFREISINSTTTQRLDREAATFLGDRASKEDVISSQSSADSSMAQTVKIIPGQCSESNSEVQDPGTRTKQTNVDGSTSFGELFIMAGHNLKSVGQYDNSKMHALNQQNGMKHDKQSQNLATADCRVSSLVASTMPSSDNHLTASNTARSLAVDYCKGCLEESKTSEFSEGKNEKGMIKGNIFRNEAAFQANLSVTTHETEQYLERLVGELKIVDSPTQGRNSELHLNKLSNFTREISDVSESISVFNIQKSTEHNGLGLNSKEHNYSSIKVLNVTNDNNLAVKRKRVGKEKAVDVNWDILRKQAQANGIRKRTANTRDSLDWEAVRCADVGDIAHTIRERGMNNILAERIKDFLNRLVSEHGSLDLEWLRDVPPDKAKEYLLSIRGLGLKSVECVRLLTLHHLAFPVDTNVGRIAVRLGWVPLQPLPESLQLHLLELYPVLESIQKYLWPRLCKLEQRTLYELHYQMITFGKVFCTKSKPNCNACPMRGECRHFASAFASARLALPAPEEKSVVRATENRAPDQTPAIITARLQLPPSQVNQHPVENYQLQALKASEAIQPLEAKYGFSNNEPIIEEPATPEPECIQITESDIEYACFEDPDEIPTIKLDMDEFTQNLQEYMQKNMELQEGDMSRALVALGPEAASLPTPKLKYISRLRTEHQVYELPDSHPLLYGLDKREPDDPCSYLLAIWTPGETTNSIQPPEETCKSQKVGELCSERTCFSCNSIREANSQTVRGTLLIPCRTAMKGSFPLNGTYFQVNEVFADHDSSLNPIDVPRAWIWNLPRRTVYFGTSIPTIFKGLTTEDIQYCFWRGFVCVRGFDQKLRAPRPLIARLHFPASRLIKSNTKTNEWGVANSSHL